MKEAVINLLEKHRRNNDLTLDFNIERYVEKLLNNAKMVCVFEKGILNNIVAYYDNDLENKIGFISMFVVDEEKQRTGVGTWLLETVIKDLKKRSFEKLRLEVSKTNKKALPFYAKFGFSTVEIKEKSLILEVVLQEL